MQKGDVIYRQMAIDAVLKRDANCGIDSAEVLKKLPSAQPELTDEDVKLIKQLRSYHNGSYAKVIDKLLAVASAQPSSSCAHENDSISRRATIDAALKESNTDGAYGYMDTKSIVDLLNEQPPAQPEPAIPISWLEKEIEHLESRKNGFARMDAAYLKALIEQWESEQNDTE